jgi:hypothetical protein
LVVQSELLARQETIEVIEPELRLGHLLRLVSSTHLAARSEDRRITTKRNCLCEDADADALAHSR